MKENIIEALNSIKPLSKTEKAAFLGIIHEVNLDKGDCWIQENTLCNKIAFIINGYLRKFYNKDGNEVTDSFYFENSFCADLPSVIGRHPLTSSTIAMTPTTLLVFDYSDFLKLCDKSHSFEKIYRILLEQTFLQFYKRTTSFILQTPKQRYDDLIKNQPLVLQRATQYHIASYLGISYQHLSRLKSEK
ncbi:MAG: Crp/Fnr family transcriptional regulator [Sporocytophaga sp.]|uniref:Crp/Fnr family transcriptional regulator n=1 Tax=Sporocytophaga sp. TaxID=2231183 RepID=UPI001B10F147|nr:Crp/Fnr family transcriptional regulator [Sporocytophaga sp.]MBO9699984.1 Crp/Fnr family transcriptional regulator [Sporocytophaga sp.]